MFSESLKDNSLIFWNCPDAKAPGIRTLLKDAGYDLKVADTLHEVLLLLASNNTTPVILPVELGDSCFEDLPDSMLVPMIAWGDDEDSLKPFLDRGVRAYMLPPFTYPLIQTQIETKRDYLRLNLDALDIGRHVELKLIERDVEIGRDIQLSFLPKSLPERPGWELSAFFRPAREVAGDFYDGFELLHGRRIGVVMADVCDKGVPAAIFMALFRTLIRAGAQQNISLSWASDPSAGADDKVWLGGLKGEGRQALPRIGTSALLNAVAGTNNYMTENHLETGYFVTLFFGIFDPLTGQLIYINGGHNPPVIVRADGTQVMLKPTGPAVGMIPGATFKIAQEMLNPGDTLFTYTDGVTDAKSETGHFFGNKNMLELLKEPITSAQSLIERYQTALDNHIESAPQFDDITMLVVRREP
ncbi:PP2C family protein-serine/threonine phosphatase [Deinococcus roseus]|uniref:PPM-type phosphatase domain-containing protein n=1 Tax=Deinococcus roseus TaxID=392414 RepID=A0ABQ2DAX2_9DEIO|nr:PP2C family protein-serine/threonine phosphatase [Deinococcus roseus]GGJ52061.1 hypothetical protein GCM10008938_42590 [Deinococcus roseus]